MENGKTIAWLWRYREAELAIDRLSEDIRRWASRAARVTAVPRLAPGGAGGHASPQESCLKKIAVLQQQIVDKIDTLAKVKAEVEAVIGALPSPQHRQVLRLRYLQGLSFEQMADTLNYSVRQISRLHGAAVRGLVASAPKPPDSPPRRRPR